MNTCKDCKWWEPPKDGHDHHNKGTCTHEKLACGDPEQPDTLSAGEVWGQDLLPDTGPDFGCVHWEKKP